MLGQTATLLVSVHISAIIVMDTPTSLHTTKDTTHATITNTTTILQHIIITRLTTVTRLTKTPPINLWEMIVKTVEI